jgi:hypothetical protein
MNEPIQSKSRGAIEAAWPLRVKNTTSEEVPPFAVMQVVSTSNTNQEEEYRVTKPTGSSGASYIINSPFPIAGNLFGSGTMGVATAAYNAALGTPTTGAEWGPVNGSWLLSPSGKGFTILGGAANGLVRVAPKGGATAGDDFPLVKIVNVSGLARSFGNIVGYGNSVDPPPATLSRIPTFQSAAPQAGQPFCVLLTDAGLNQTVDAGPVGVVPCQIYLNDATHKYADAINNQYSWLGSAATGPALILWREKQGIVGGGTLGLQWARVRLDPVAMTSDPRGVIESTVTAASGFRSAATLTPGFGTIRLYLPPASGPIGTAWNKGTTIQAETWMHATSAIGKPVILRESRKAPDGSTIYLAIAEGCKEVPS